MKEKKNKKVDILCAVAIVISIILIPVAVKLDNEIQRKNVKEIFQISQQELFTEHPVRIDGTQDLQDRFDALMQTCNRIKLPEKDLPIRISKISRYEYVRDVNRTVCILYLENGEIYTTELSSVAFY